MPRLLALLVALSVAQAGCVRRMVASAAADALAGPGTFGSDDDPELVRDALPFGLKSIEALLAGSPDDPRLLLAASSGFTQYSYGFLAADADELEPRDPDGARALRERAKRLLDRAIRYGMHGLEVLHPGTGGALEGDRKAALAPFEKADVPLLYWTGAALGARLALSKDDMKVLATMPRIEALMARALELDEGWDEGAIHEFLQTWESSRSEAMGGSVERAKKHRDRALELSKGRKLAPWVAWAENVAVAQQDRAAFDEVLAKVLAFDVNEEPRLRLVNILAQRRARRLQARAEDLFL